MNNSKERIQKTIIENSALDTSLKIIAEKILNGERITSEEGTLLYEKGELGFVGTLANFIREKLHGNKTYFNRNFHIEPTNLCVFSCNFCSYSRTLKEDGEGWFMSQEQILDIVRSYKDKPETEVHIVGGVHPKLTLDFFADTISKIKQINPKLHVKAFTAVELEYMFRKAKVTVREGLQILKNAGMESIPGGGAEIFHPEIREQICADKANAKQWLEIHETAHELGMPSNATMLYGHIEKYEHRIDHMERLRQLQDKSTQLPTTNHQPPTFFNAFIPLKFRNKDNAMSHLKEVSVIEDLKNYAIARIYLDNFAHLKAYWPMIGKNTAQLSLSFGVDDIDGTIDDSTKIYSMAGAEEHPAMTTREIVEMIKAVGKHPIERDTVYKVVKDYKEVVFEEKKDFFVNIPVGSNYTESS